jgi:ABC-type uncharacterized transport system fused permease/ATPase subunit
MRWPTRNPRHTYSDEALRQALDEALLPDLAARLDEEDAWSQKLSGGEQQRLAIARVLLKKPNGFLPTKPPAHSTKPPKKRCMSACSRS